jgi:hypothetical protein
MPILINNNPYQADHGHVLSDGVQINYKIHNFATKNIYFKTSEAMTRG